VGAGSLGASKESSPATGEEVARLQGKSSPATGKDRGKSSPATGENRGKTPGPWAKVEALDRGESFGIAVSNSGAPIPPEIADRVMDAFFTTKPPGKGTGLGLSISSSLAKVHNGNLRLDPSSPTPRFVLVLPKRQPLSAVTHESAA
jgi:signal transduction histidine kinase